jgi:hypothetical protein
VQTRTAIRGSIMALSERRPRLNRARRVSFNRPRVSKQPLLEAARGVAHAHGVSRTLHDFGRWMFSPPEPPIQLWRVILWWELRRIPYNIFVGLYGILCLAIFYWGITTSGHLEPGEDAIEPLALISAPFLVNFAYTLGWIVEGAAQVFGRPLPEGAGPRLLKLGLGFSAFVISLPAALWSGYRVLQLARLMT